MNEKFDSSEDRISTILKDPEMMTKIIRSGINDALLKHKLLRNPICVWSDKENRVVWIPPDQIPTD